MIIDYEKEFINLLGNNKITHLPSQELIDNSIRVALLVWENYCPNLYKEEYENQDYPQWGNILSKYKDNKQFWEKAFELTSSHDMLFDDDFKIDFPNIVNYWLSNDTMLLQAFSKTNNTRFNDLLNDEQSKKSFYKNYLLNNLYNVSSKNIKLFEDDKDSLLKILKNSPYLYKDLSEENKLKHDYIKLALTKKEMLQEIPLDYQKNPTIRNYWFTVNINNFSHKEFDFLQEKEKLLILNHKPNYLNTLLDMYEKQYVPLIIEVISQDIKKINNVSLDNIKKYLQNDLLKNQNVLNQLTDFVNNYKKDSLKEDIKIFELINASPIKNQLKENMFYIFREKKLNKKRFNKEQYDMFVSNIVENKDSEDNNKKLLLILKSVTETDVLKTLPKTKDLYLYYKTQKMAHNLQEKLPEKISTKIKIKL